MRLYKPQFRDAKTGESRETKRWYLDIVDHHGTRQRFKGDIDRHVTEELGLKLGDLVKCRKRSVQPDDKLWSWLMALPTDVMENLVRLDLAERQWFNQLTQAERLDDWIAEFENWLSKSKAKSGYHRNHKHIETTMGRIHKIVSGCGFKTWAGITKGAVETFLGGLSVKMTTHNGYIGAVKLFCTWCVRERRAEFSPLQHLCRITVPDKEYRRPLEFEEVNRLLAATSTAADRYGMSGFDRAVLYRVSIETGFRANELRHLNVSDFDSKKAIIKLDAMFCKGRRDAVQHITMSLASRLADYLAGREPTDPMFDLKTYKTAVMIKDDAVKAGLPLKDDEGRELVFHSLRHTLRTELVRARLTEAIIDNIMRHKPQGIGSRFYSHLTDFEIREGVERLPEYIWPGDIQQQAEKVVS